MKKRLLFLGPPGAGKGTQAEILCKRNGLKHLSTGDLLRAEVSLGSPLGKQASSVMSKGELVSDDLVLSIVEKTLLEINNLGWLLDGFPRNVGQAESLEALLEKIQQPVEAVLLLELSDDLLIERLLSRGRDDDNESVIRHRLDVYRDKTAPLIDYYSNQGLLKALKGDGNIDEISMRIKKALS